MLSWQDYAADQSFSSISRKTLATPLLVHSAVMSVTHIQKARMFKPRLQQFSKQLLTSQDLERRR